MKFIISLITSALTLSAFAAPIRIYHMNQFEKAKLTRNIFTKTYKVPEDLLEILKTRNCDELSDRGKLDMCINDNGDLLVVSVDKRFISETLKIFQAP